MADRFRLTYLKSTGVGRSDLDQSFLFQAPGRTMSSLAPLPERGIPGTFSSEAILKQAKADLKHPDPQVRIWAIKYYIEKSFPSIPMTLLQEVLSDQDPEVRTQALRSLIKFRNPIASPLLKKHLKDSYPKVRIAALRGIFQCQEKIDLNILLQFLSDESPWVRRKVATLIGWKQIEGSLPILTELSRDQEPIVRRAALFSLAVLYPDESQNRLMEVLTDSDPGLRKWAKMTLEKMVDRPFKRKTTSPVNRD